MVLKSAFERQISQYLISSGLLTRCPTEAIDLSTMWCNFAHAKDFERTIHFFNGIQCPEDIEWRAYTAFTDSKWIQKFGRYPDLTSADIIELIKFIQQKWAVLEQLYDIPSIPGFSDQSLPTTTTTSWINPELKRRNAVAGTYLRRDAFAPTATASTTFATVSTMFATATAMAPRITLTTNAATSINSPEGAAIVNSKGVEEEEDSGGRDEGNPHLRELYTQAKASVADARRVSGQRRLSFSGKLPIIQTSKSEKKSVVKTGSLWLARKIGKMF
jgi:hypothetical protein